MNQELQQTLKSQIIAIRDSGLTNMFDTGAVYQIAFRCGYKELMKLIEKDGAVYARFIMRGEF